MHALEPAGRAGTKSLVATTTRRSLFNHLSMTRPGGADVMAWSRERPGSRGRRAFRECRRRRRSAVLMGVRCRTGAALRGLAVLVVSSLVVLSGCGGGGATGSASGSPLPSGTHAHDASLLAGRQLFSANCASCHGVAGQGGLGPSFTNGRLLRDFPNAADQITFVSNGRGLMPAFATALTPRQIADVVAYERQVLSSRSGS
jgi:cytochrome c553